MSYLNNIEDDWRADKITRDELVELRKAYANATPEKKTAIRTNYQIQNESNSKTSEQKTLEAIRSNTSTIVNILTFYLVLFLISIIYMLVQVSKY